MGKESGRQPAYRNGHSPVRILSLGAGVQSSTVAMMMRQGEIPNADHAIFADTGDEPRAVYDYLDYLRPLLPMPLHVVAKGRLSDDFLAALDDPRGRCGQPPFMVWNHEKQLGGRLWRKCTKEYKLDPIRRKVRELREGRRVEQIIGISLDEAMRMKPSGVKYITNVYPLVDLRMTRADCLQWMERNGYRMPPKSACVFCPYIANDRLRDMRDNAPKDWSALVEFDHEMRRRQRATVNGARITGTLYVHRDCKPIDEVDLRTAADFGQRDMFEDGCVEGICGV